MFSTTNHQFSLTRTGKYSYTARAKKALFRSLRARPGGLKREIQMIVMIDNYDSFTYNLVQCISQLGGEVMVYRNDAITADDIGAMKPEMIVVSPGPCTPTEAGISIETIRRFHRHIPILGVCLGHQAIGQAFGGRVIRAERVMHGKTSPVSHDGKTVFTDIPNPFTAGRYHSLIVERKTLPDCLEISAETADGEIMGLRHRSLPVEGIQFHPESVLTPSGMAIIGNFLSLAKVK
jgi:anthranilate synthase/aminodeoxychorismate synthase-like glutamine amidotransferase